MAASAVIAQSKNPTIIEIVRECDEVWAMAKKLQASGKGDEEVFDLLAENHPDLVKVYPAIISAMICGDYSPKAVRKFFKYVQKHPWKNEEEFYDVQSAYSTYLFRILQNKKGAHTGVQDCASVRAQSRQALEANQKHIKELSERAQEIAKQRIARMMEDRKKILATVVSTAAPIITECEVRPIVVNYDSS